MLKNAVKILSIFVLFTQSTTSFAASHFSDKQFLACEEKLLKHQKLSIELDKEQKEAQPNSEKLTYIEKNLEYLERITEKHCSGFTAQAY